MSTDNVGGAPREFAFSVDLGKLQLILLALAKLSVDRPGWLTATRELAALLGHQPLFEDFRKTSFPPANCFIDSSNKFQVVRDSQPLHETVIVLKMEPSLGNYVFEVLEAANLAAWLTEMSSPTAVERIRAEITKPCQPNF